MWCLFLYDIWGSQIELWSPQDTDCTLWTYTPWNLYNLFFPRSSEITKPESEMQHPQFSHPLMVSCLTVAFEEDGPGHGSRTRRGSSGFVGKGIATLWTRHKSLPCSQGVLRSPAGTQSGKMGFDPQGALKG